LCDFFEESMNIPSSVALNIGKDFASLPVFQGVEADVMRELMASAHTAQYQKGTIFLSQGAPVSRFYVILEGWCGASKGNAEGQEAILQIFRRGDFLLESILGIFADISPINLQALTPVHLLTLAPAAVSLAAERSGILTANMLTASVRRCQELRNHIEQLTLHNAEQRVGRCLLQTRFNASPDGKDIVLPFDKSLIAAYLGIKPETLSRVFQTFRDRGFTVERSHLTVPFRQALCAYCDKITMQSCPFAHTRDCSNAAPDTPAAKGNAADKMQ
jgi:CRP-like cAMP-binding protein